MDKSFAAIASRLMLAAAVSAAMITLLLNLVTGVAPEHLPGVFEVLPKISLPLAGLAFALTVGQSLFRSIRYRVLLRSSLPDAVPGPGRMLMITFVRNMLVDSLPGRIGELGYVALLNMSTRVGVAEALMSLAVSFAFDLIALAAIVLLFLGAGALVQANASSMLPFAALLLLIAAAGWAAVFKGLAAVLPLLRRLGGRRFALWRQFLELLARTDTAIRTVRRQEKIATIMGLSLAVRVCKYTGMYACFLAVAGGAFPEMARAKPWRVLTAQLFSEAGSSLPLPTLMGFGSYEAGGTAAWALFGFNAAQAVLVVLLVHICSQLMDYSLGIAGGIALYGLGGWRRAAWPGKTAAPLRARGPAFLLIPAAVLLIILMLAASQIRRFSKLGAVRAPGAGTALAPEAGPAADRRLAGLHARVAWSSNRSGQHDLFEMDFPGGSVRRLTTNLHVDSFPAYSPSGATIAFARSQHPWVSQRNSVPWDIYLLDVLRGEERLLARNGIAPRWRDENSVVFERGGKAIIQCDTATGSEVILAEAGRSGIPAGARLYSPAINPRTGELLLTVRGAERMTALVAPGKGLQRIGGGCQASWLPALSGVYWVDGGGRMTNQVWIRRSGSAPQPLLDLAGAFSHEYFPKFSADGRWLVLAASAGGHEHDTADYEIFIWRAGTPGAEAVRLTFHTGNDSWPDIFVEAPGK